MYLFYEGWIINLIITSCIDDKENNKNLFILFSNKIFINFALFTHQLNLLNFSTGKKIKKTHNHTSFAILLLRIEK